MCDEGKGIENACQKAWQKETVHPIAGCPVAIASPKKKISETAFCSPPETCKHSPGSCWLPQICLVYFNSVRATCSGSQVFSKNQSPALYTDTPQTGSGGDFYCLA